ncbi:MAG: hypothetical protein J7641_20460 [Cyanobacteria bacterium SID2]|nr:hypothetical protein [Cyanobacteria bacterium SID2]MBP0003514.1 hypothetical protein [Cyanobacteria bacterium SBC]
MPVQKSHYESAIARYCDTHATVELLRQHRPYLEAIPSLRRPKESVVVLPFPLVRLREAISQAGLNGLNIRAGETVCLPSELGIFMCEPDWKVKIGIEIFMFVHRPHEDFSDLLLRWRQTQVLLDKGYEWVMPFRYRHIYGEAAQRIFPLFVLFEESPERIKRGLEGATLPFVIDSETIALDREEEFFSAESPSL